MHVCHTLHDVSIIKAPCVKETGVALQSLRSEGENGVCGADGVLAVRVRHVRASNLSFTKPLLRCFALAPPRIGTFVGFWNATLRTANRPQLILGACD